MTSLLSFPLPACITLLFFLAISTLGCEVLFEDDPYVCSEYATSLDSCFWLTDAIPDDIFEQWDAAACAVCREGASCFFAFDDWNERAICEAYMENGSCFFIPDVIDRGWCEVLKEGSSCFMAFWDWEEQSRCEHDDIPYMHYILYF